MSVTKNMSFVGGFWIDSGYSSHFCNPEKSPFIFVDSDGDGEPDAIAQAKPGRDPREGLNALNILLSGQKAKDFFNKNSHAVPSQKSSLRWEFVPVSQDEFIAQANPKLSEDKNPPELWKPGFADYLWRDLKGALIGKLIQSGAAALAPAAPVLIETSAGALVSSTATAPALGILALASVVTSVTHALGDWVSGDKSGFDVAEEMAALAVTVAASYGVSRGESALLSWRSNAQANLLRNGFEVIEGEGGFNIPHNVVPGPWGRSTVTYINEGGPARVATALPSPQPQLQVVASLNPALETAPTFQEVPLIVPLMLPVEAEALPDPKLQIQKELEEQLAALEQFLRIQKFNGEEILAALLSQIGELQNSLTTSLRNNLEGALGVLSSSGSGSSDRASSLPPELKDLFKRAKNDPRKSIKGEWNGMKIEISLHSNGEEEAFYVEAKEEGPSGRKVVVFRRTFLKEGDVFYLDGQSYKLQLDEPASEQITDVGSRDVSASTLDEGISGDKEWALIKKEPSVEPPSIVSDQYYRIEEDIRSRNGENIFPIYQAGGYRFVLTVADSIMFSSDDYILMATLKMGAVWVPVKDVYTRTPTFDRWNGVRSLKIEANTSPEDQKEITGMAQRLNHGYPAGTLENVVDPREVLVQRISPIVDPEIPELPARPVEEEGPPAKPYMGNTQVLPNNRAKEMMKPREEGARALPVVAPKMEGGFLGGPKAAWHGFLRFVGMEKEIVVEPLPAAPLQPGVDYEAFDNPGDPFVFHLITSVKYDSQIPLHHAQIPRTQTRYALFLTGSETANIGRNNFRAKDPENLKTISRDHLTIERLPPAVEGDSPSFIIRQNLAPISISIGGKPTPEIDEVIVSQQDIDQGVVIRLSDQIEFELRGELEITP